MTYDAETIRDENGTTVVFTFANGKTVSLKARDFKSGKAMVEAAQKIAAA